MSVVPFSFCLTRPCLDSRHCPPSCQYITRLSYSVMHHVVHFLPGWIFPYGLAIPLLETTQWTNTMWSMGMLHGVPTPFCRQSHSISTYMLIYTRGVMLELQSAYYEQIMFAGFWFACTFAVIRCT